MPKVSICIPTYNRAHLVGEAIESALAQEYDDFEVLVSDNCSTDATAEVVARYQDAGVRYVRADHNRGYVGNLNRCLELAEGEYVMILYDDDLLLPMAIGRLAGLLDAHPTAGFAYSGCDYVNDAGEVVARLAPYERDFVEDGRWHFRRNLMRKLIPASTVMVRAGCYQEVGPYDPDLYLYADEEMWLRLCLSYDVAYSAEFVGKARGHQGSMTQLLAKVSVDQEASAHLAGYMGVSTLEHPGPVHFQDLCRMYAKVFNMQAVTTLPDHRRLKAMAAGQALGMGMGHSTLPVSAAREQVLTSLGPWWTWVWDSRALALWCLALTGDRGVQVARFAKGLVSKRARLHEA